MEELNEFKNPYYLVLAITALLLGNKNTDKKIKQVMDGKDNNEIVIETFDNKKFTIKVTEEN